jgi:hypothetical protein
VHKLGSTVPIKVQVQHNGLNVSSASLSATVLGWSLWTATPWAFLRTRGRRTPPANFRYDAALQGYIFNLSTKSLRIAGTYRLNVKAGSDQTVHPVLFKVR